MGQYTIVILLLALFRAFSLVAGDYVASTTVTGDVAVVTSAANSPFDGPKISAVNSTAFDWWYFDAVSREGNQQITVIFFRAALEVNGKVPSTDYVEVTVTFPNGTSHDSFFFGTSSSVTTDGEGATGIWNGTGCSFSGTPDLSQYTVTIKNEVFNGTLVLDSIAPAHYPDGSPASSTTASVTAVPGVYGCNAIPGGKATVQFTAWGEDFEFYDGAGYHDKNWGGNSLASTITSWYWGHAIVGAYTLVWFDGIAAGTNTRYSSTYLVENGKVLLSGQPTPFAANSDFAFVLPYGNGTEYPPANDQLPSGFLISYVGNQGQLWQFLAQGVYIALDTSEGGLDGYTRWSGTVTGGEVGGAIASGSGVWEWIRYYST